MAGKSLSQSLAILFIVVIIAAHSTKNHVMALRDIIKDVLPIAEKLLQTDPICGKPCNTRNDCAYALYCIECYNHSRTCGPPRGY